MEVIVPKTLEAVFDGKVFHPETPPVLEPNTRVRITIEMVIAPSEQAPSFLDLARSLNLEGPPDWSSNLEGYLYHQEERDDG